MPPGPASPVSPVMTATIMPQHRGNTPSNDWRARNVSGGNLPSHGAAGLDEVFASDEDASSAATTSPAPAFNMRALSNASNTYPGADASDAILWSRWDYLREGNTTRRLLLLGYIAGLQVWDCSRLGSVTEILNLAGRGWGRVTFAGVLPTPPSESDSYVNERPLLGIV